MFGKLSFLGWPVSVAKKFGYKSTEGSIALDWAINIGVNVLLIWLLLRFLRRT